MTQNFEFHLFKTSFKFAPSITRASIYIPTSTIIHLDFRPHLGRLSDMPPLFRILFYSRPPPLFRQLPLSKGRPGALLKK